VADRRGGKDGEVSGMQVHLVDVARGGYRLNVQSPDRARGLVGNLRFPARPCVLGRSGNTAAAAAADRLLARSRNETAKGGGEALQRSTRSLGGGVRR
jgi:hypothetical protein